MKAGAGKRKGGSFERWVARTLSQWLTGKPKSQELIRSVTSGGWAAGLESDAPWRHVGDLAPNGKVGDAFRKRFAVECKHHREIDLYELWTSENGRLLKWWRKLLLEVEPHDGLDPMLIMRSNFRPDIVVLPELFCRQKLWGAYPTDPEIMEAMTFSRHDLVLMPLTRMLAQPASWYVPELKV